MKANADKRQRRHVTLDSDVIAYVEQFQAISKAPNFSRSIEQLIMHALHDQGYIETTTQMADAVERGIVAGVDRAANRLAKIVVHGCLQAGEAKHAVTNLFELAMIDEYADLDRDWKRDAEITVEDIEAYLELAKETPERETAAQFMRKRSGRWRYRAVRDLRKSLSDELKEMVDEIRAGEVDDA